MKGTNYSEEQAKVLTIMRNYLAHNGELPSLGYISDQLDYKYKSQAQYHVNILKEKNLLKDLEKNSILKEIPLVGNVSCGPAILAEENIEAYIPIDASTLKDKKAKYFFLKADGDSMNQAGVLPGDFVLIRQQVTARLNDIIVALIGDDATLKKLGRTKEGVAVLMPCSDNPFHKPRIMLEDFSVLGVLERVIHPKRSVTM